MNFRLAPLLVVAAIPISLGLLPTAKPDTMAGPGMRVNRVFLFRAIPFEARPGQIVTLKGSGFSRTANTIYFNGSNSVTATSSNGVDMNIVVPYGISEGVYELTVSNILGFSDKTNPNIHIKLKVTNNPLPAPLIKSASISGDTVTLTGEGFTSSNLLITTLGELPGAISSSGGTSLTFRITDLSWYRQITQSTLGRYRSALWIYVQNEHGINEDAYKLDIVI